MAYKDNRYENLGSEKKMNVGILAQFSQFGGTRTYFEALVQFYVKENANVTVFLEPGQTDKRTTDFIQSAGAKYAVLPNRPKICRRFPFNLWFDVRKVYPIIKKHQPDLVTISDGPLTLYAGLMKFDLKILYIVHTYPEVQTPKVYRKIFNRALDEKKLTILTVSEFAKKNIIKFCLDFSRRNRVKVIYHTIFQDDYKRAQAVPKTVLTLGHVEEYKNPLFWLKVADKVISKNPDVKFIWAGDGSQIELAQSLIPTRLNDKITFVGYIAEVEKLYQNTDVYFQPSRTESFGLSVLEALKNGIPAVVSNVGGLVECVRDNQNSYVFNLPNADEATKCILTLLTNKNKYEQFSRNAREWYRQNFSNDVWHKKMQNLHDQL